METLINEAHSEYLDDIKLDVVKVGYLSRVSSSS